jgi:hypothetical protein
MRGRLRCDGGAGPPIARTFAGRKFERRDLVWQGGIELMWSVHRGSARQLWGGRVKGHRHRAHCASPRVVPHSANIQGHRHIAFGRMCCAAAHSAESRLQLRAARHSRAGEVSRVFRTDPMWQGSLLQYMELSASAPSHWNVARRVGKSYESTSRRPAVWERRCPPRLLDSSRRSLRVDRKETLREVNLGDLSRRVSVSARPPGPLPSQGG